MGYDAVLVAVAEAVVAGVDSDDLDGYEAFCDLAYFEAGCWAGDRVVLAVPGLGEVAVPLEVVPFAPVGSVVVGASGFQGSWVPEAGCWEGDVPPCVLLVQGAVEGL